MEAPQASTQVNELPRLAPTAQRILDRIRTEGSVRRVTLGPMRSGGYYTATQRAILALLGAGLIVQGPTPEHAGRVQYRLAPAVA